MKLQCTYTDEKDFKALLFLLSSRGYRVSVRPAQELPAKLTKGGNFLRWISLEI